MNHYRQAIHISANVTDIMRLPCVATCQKEDDGTLTYLLYDWQPDGSNTTARQGDWLVEHTDGSWHVVSDKEWSSRGGG